MKRCYACGLEKPVELFSVDRSRSDGRVSRCKACRHAHYQQTREQVAIASKAYNLANAEQRKERGLAYYYANKDARSARMAEWYEANKAQVALKQAAWRRENLHKLAAKRARARAALVRATPVWASSAGIARVYEQSERMTRETGIAHHVDHVVPLNSKIVCGLHCEANLRAIPGADNLSKSNRYWPDMP